jgi:uncharacterized protein (TIGR03435 family)
VDRIDFRYVTLWYCLSYAYGVKSYQMSGPDWLRQERFDMAARGPSGTTREQLPKMMQKLLADRFGVQVRRENREIAGLALVVGKNGPKLTPSTLEQDGANVNMSATSTGVERMEVKNGTMTTLVNTLTGLIGRPVVDMTGLDGRYDFALEFSRGDSSGPRASGGYNEPPSMPPPGPGAEPGLSIFSSIQQVGLKLEARKIPLDTIIVERAERVPTEN